MFAQASTSPLQRGSPSGIPPGATLVERHAQYLADRGVDASLARQAFWTAQKPSEIPSVFSEYQRRGAPALVAAFPSPDGETVAFQMRSDYPRKNRKGQTVKWMSPPGKNARMVLGVLPEMVDSVRTGVGPLWSVEGITRSAALASFGIPAVAFAGCWGWQSGSDPLKCWQHVNLKGRQVLVAFDADYRSNRNVHGALRQHVAFLEERGARVLVVDVPEVNGDVHAGLDDWIADNGHPGALQRAARPFEPVDIRRVRLSADEKLRREVEALWTTWEAMVATKRSDCTDRSTMRELIKVAEERGKITTDGLKVSPSVRTLSEPVRIGRQAQANSLKRLLEKGYIRKAAGHRGKKEAQAYILLPKASPRGREFGGHYGEGGKPGKESKAQEDSKVSFIYRKSSLSVHQTRGGDEGVPELRETKVVRQWERAESPNGGGGRWRVVDSHVIARLGKKRGEILRYLVSAEGSVSIGELIERFSSPKTRVRDFKRDCLADLRGFRETKGGRVDLGPPIILIDGDTVRLTPKWRENLEIRREIGEEQEDAKLQAEKIARERERFHNPKKSGPEAEATPPMPSRKKVQSILRVAEERDEAAKVDWQRENVGETVEEFIHYKLAKLGSIRLELLTEMWKAEGGDPVRVLIAVKSLGYKLEYLSKFNEWFVYPRQVPKPNPKPEPEPEPESQPELESEPEPPRLLSGVRWKWRPVPLEDGDAPVVIMPFDEALPMWLPPQNKDGIYEHPPKCDCDLCDYEVLPRYATGVRR